MKAAKASPEYLECRECGESVADYLGDHLLEAHGLALGDYLAKHQGAKVTSDRLLNRFSRERGSPPQRQHPPAPDNLFITLAGGIQFKVNPNVPEEACLPMPQAYRFPAHGELARDVRHALISIWKRRSTMIWGVPGSGKDAFIHAISALTRTPGIERQIKPGADIQSWFYTRSFNSEGTFWEEGPLLKALRDGYEVKDRHGNVIERVPYIILFTDFDRADRAQAEYMRLIMDSIKGRVEGPQGQTYPVLPGTMIVATANTAGSGDDRGRCVSANVMDASILDRFERVFQFHWMDWKDEEQIVREKFPYLAERAPQVFGPMGRITQSLREAILKEDLYAEFSHRGLCSILEHAQDILESNGKNAVPANLLRMAARAWLDRLSDPTSRLAAKRHMDPHLAGGALDSADGGFG